MYKNDFTPRDFLNPHHRVLMDKVAGIFVAATGGDRSCVILEGLGTWLEQLDWSDRSGYFLKLRLAPLDKGRPGVHDAGKAIIAGFSALFPGKKAEVLNGDTLLDGGTVTVKVHTDTYSIGD